MFQISENDRDSQVHARAKQRGQATFTLVAQDVSAPTTIYEWIKLNIESAPADKLRDALESALAMRNYQKRKRAD